MSRELSCTWEEFRGIARDFLVAAPTAPDLDALDNGQKCVALSYLNCVFDETPLGEHQRTISAIILMNMVTKTFIQREIELTSYDYQPF